MKGWMRIQTPTGETGMLLYLPTVPAQGIMCAKALQPVEAQAFGETCVVGWGTKVTISCGGLP